MPNSCSFLFINKLFLSDSFEGDLHARMDLLIVLRDGLDVRVPTIFSTYLSHSLLRINDVDLLRRVESGSICLICIIDALRG